MEQNLVENVVPKVLQGVALLKKAKAEGDLTESSISLAIDSSVTSIINVGTTSLIPDTIDASLSLLETYFEGLAEVHCGSTDNDCYIELTSQSPTAMSFRIGDFGFDTIGFDYFLSALDEDDYFFVSLDEQLLFGEYGVNLNLDEWLNLDNLFFGDLNYTQNSLLTIGLLTEQDNRSLRLKDFRFYSSEIANHVNAPSKVYLLLLVLLCISTLRTKKFMLC